RSSVLLKCVMSRPSILMLPPVGSIRRRMVRPTVDLPQPDSPPRPSVSPCAIEKLMPSTANTVPPARCNRPLRTGKCFLRSRTSSTAGREPLVAPASAIALTEQLSGTPARCPVARAFFLVIGIGAAAALLGVGAARREHAALRQIGQCWHHAGDFLQAPAGVLVLPAHQRQSRDRGYQPVRIGMLRPGEQLVDRRLL